jgi:rhamnose transport system permease protein
MHRLRPHARELGLLAFLAVLTAAICVRFPEFAAWSNVSAVADDTSLLLILALGQALVLLTRAVDLSIAANVALSGMLAALVNAHFPELGVAGAIAAALACGTVLGAINGVLVWKLRVPPIVATLGTMSLFRGGAYLATGGEWVNSNVMSSDFLGLPRVELLGLTLPTWVSLIVFAGVAMLLRSTRLGRSFFAAGDNPEASIYVGIDPGRAQFWAYLICGALAGIVSYFWVSRFGVAYTDTAIGFELQVIAACVIGGVAINGGAGSAVGVLLGALFLGIVRNALPLIGVSPFWQMAVSGAVIIAAVLANALATRPPRKRILEASGA